MSWVKLTNAQAAAIDALSATNTGAHFIVPVLDSKGAKWIGADVLTEPNFAHYAPALVGLSVSNSGPVFAASAGV